MKRVSVGGGGGNSMVMDDVEQEQAQAQARPLSSTNARSPTKKKNRMFSPTEKGKVFSFE